MFSILVVEDDATLNKMLCTKLRLEGFDPVGVPDGARAIELTASRHVDLVITDLMMPNVDGNELIRELRSWRDDLPILVMTAKGQTEDMAESFGLGADDYLVKPVDLQQMVLHVRALLRRARLEREKRVTLGSTELDMERLTLSWAGRSQELPPKEFGLLFKLASRPGRVFTRAELLEEIWGPESDSDERNVDAHVKKLRHRLEGNPDLAIETVRGLGYKAVLTRGGAGESDQG
jgi:two-component system OmpR family response regulator